MKLLVRFLRHGLCLLSVATLVACGGGGGSAESSAPAPTPAAPAPSAPTASTASLVDGTITGFGSVIIDGQRFDDSVAKVAFLNKPESAADGTLADLRTGMRVLAEFKDGVLQSLNVNFALAGAVSAVDSAAGTVSVLGQTIKLISGGQLPTVLEGFSSLSQLKAGDWIKVSGSVASDGSISASRIERRSKEAGELIRLSGAVQGLDATNKRFSLSGNSSLSIDYSAAKLLPTGALIENGKLVSVLASTTPVSSGGSSVLSASAVEIKAKKLGDSANISVGGQISDFQSLAALRIGDVKVDASTAELKDGTVAADVVNGAQALAQGALTDGVLKAKSLKVFKNDTAIKALLIGQITDFVSLSNFTLRGTTVDASGASFSKGRASDLATGTWVKISGSLTATGVLAKEIEVQPPPADKPARLAGTLSELDLSARRFTLLATRVQWADGVKFSPEGKTAANLANGSAVQVEGSYSEANALFTATSITVLTPPSATRTVGFSGIVYELGSNSFKVGSNLVKLSQDTKFEPSGSSLADLANGVRVSVKATLALVDGQPVLTALNIELQKPEKDGEGHELVYAAGLISDYVSAANFKLAGQRVDASGANVEFIDGTVAKLANGLKVEIKGSVKDGVLIARRVHFMPG